MRWQLRGVRWAFPEMEMAIFHLVAAWRIPPTSIGVSNAPSIATFKIVGPTDEMHPYQMQRNRSGLIDWPDCLVKWYTPNFIFRISPPPSYACTRSHGYGWPKISTNRGMLSVENVAVCQLSRYWWILRVRSRSPGRIRGVEAVFRENSRRSSGINA